MKGKRYSLEQIIARLREAEKLQAQGMTVAQVCKKLHISDQTFFRRRTKCVAERRRSAAAQGLERENTRLMKIVAEQALDILMLKDLTKENGKPGASPGRGALSGAPAQGLRAPGVQGDQPTTLEMNAIR